MITLVTIQNKWR